MKTLPTLLILALLVVSCAEQSAYDKSLSLVQDIENSSYVKGNVWLEQNVMGTWAKEVLVFGYIDNYEGCLDFIEINVKKYGGTYRCIVIE